MNVVLWILNLENGPYSFGHNVSLFVRCIKSVCSCLEMIREPQMQMVALPTYFKEFQRSAKQIR